MPRGQWRSALGVRPRRRPPRRRASPAPIFLVIGGVESVLWEGCYPGGANRASSQVFINAGARLLCTLDGVCDIVYV